MRMGPSGSFVGIFWELVLAAAFRSFGAPFDAISPLSGVVFAMAAMSNGTRRHQRE